MFNKDFLKEKLLLLYCKPGISRRQTFFAEKILFNIHASAKELKRYLERRISKNSGYKFI
jgi:hypothetical protein